MDRIGSDRIDAATLAAAAESAAVAYAAADDEYARLTNVVGASLADVALAQRASWAAFDLAADAYRAASEAAPNDRGLAAVACVFSEDGGTGALPNEFDSDALAYSRAVAAVAALRAQLADLLSVETPAEARERLAAATP
jgi:hypothetical protein